VEISDIFKESYRNQSRLQDLRPEVEEILSRVLNDLENGKTNEKAPHNIESNLYSNINLIPSDFYGQCTDLLIVLCYCLWQDKPTYNCSAKVHNSASSLGQKKKPLRAS